MLIPASAISKGPAAPSSMKMLAHNSLPRFAAWITSCSSPNPTSNLFWKSFSRMSTPKALTTLWTPCPSVLSPNGCASVWPSWATPRITPRENSWTLFARRRMPEPRFLVVRLGSLGDIVHTFPAVAALRESFPKAEIVWLTHPRWKALVESSELATDILVTETRSYKSLRETIGRIHEKHFTAAIDYQGLWKSAALPFFGGVSRRIGFSSQSIREFGVPVLYTDRVLCTKSHIADQNGELSRRAGARNGVAPVTLAVPAIQEAFVLQLLRGSAVERYVVLSPAGGWRSKCWPPDRYGALCQKIRATLGLRCVLNYGPGEDDQISAIRAASGEADPIAYNGSLVQLMALLRNAVCIVGGDTGPLHLAVALGTPAVAIFGPTDPVRNGPYRMGDRSGNASPIDIVLRSPHALTTYKRGDQAATSMVEIDVDKVFDAVRRQVEVRR